MILECQVELAASGRPQRPAPLMVRLGQQTSASSEMATCLRGPASAAPQDITGAQIGGDNMSNRTELAELASEYWKLLHAFERCAAVAPESSKPRLAAQARYSGEKLTVILAKVGMRIVTFDGLHFEVNLPAIAVNAEDAVLDVPALIERTLEPAIVSDTSVIMTGKVFLAAPKKD